MKTCSDCEFYESPKRGQKLGVCWVSPGDDDKDSVRDGKWVLPTMRACREWNRLRNAEKLITRIERGLK